MLKMGSTLAFAALLAVPATGPVVAAEPTRIGITGGWPVSVTLEIGRLSITLNAHEGGGVTSVELEGPTVVRVRRLSDCVPLVRFVATPGRTYFIDWDGNGNPRVEDHTSDGLDSGPGMELHYRRSCPALPDTSTGPVPPDRDGGPAPVLAATFAAAFVWVLRATSTRVRTQRR